MFGVIPNDFGCHFNRVNSVSNGPALIKLVEPPVERVGHFVAGHLNQFPNDRLQPGQLHADGKPALQILHLILLVFVSNEN